MTLLDVLQQVNRETEIDVRVKFVIKDIPYDLFVGRCLWEHGELISIDGDDYSLDMPVESYKDREEYIVVWVGGEW